MAFESWNRSVLPQGQIARPTGPGTAALVGEGMQKLGQAGAGAAYDLARANEVIRQRQEKSDQQDATKKVLDFDASYDARFADLQKQAAPGADGFVDTVKADFDKQSAEFLKTVPASALPYAQEQVARSWSLTQGAALQFSATSRVQLDRKTAAGIIDQGSAMLVANPRKLDFVRDNVITSIKAMKLSPQEEALTLSDVDAGLSAASLGGLVQRNPRGALASIDSGAWSAVSGEKLLSLRGVAESKIKADEALARAEADRKLALQQNDLLGRLDLAIPALESTGVMPVGNDGQPLVNPGEITSLIPGRRGEALQRQFTVAQMEGQDRNSMLTTNIGDDYTKLATLAAPPGQAWSAEQQDRYTSFSTALGKKAEALENDPASIVAGSPSIQQAWQTATSLAQTPGADPKLVAQATTVAVGASMQAQADMGAARPRPLTKAQAASYAGQMKAEGLRPDSFKALAGQVASLGPAAVAQVIDAGAPPVFAAITAIDDPAVMAQFTQAATLRPSEISNILQSTGVSRDKVQAAVQEQLSVLYPTLPPETRGLYQDGFTQAAIYALGRGAKNETAAAIAVTKPLLDGVQIDGRLRVPTDLDLADVKGGLAQSMSNLLDGSAGIQVKPPPGFDSMGALREAARQGGLVWYMNEAGDGAILGTPEGKWIPVINRTSQNKAVPGRFEVKFRDAARLGSMPVEPFAIGNPAGD